MSKFDNHVILPVEEFTELQAAAYDNPTITDRIATSAQTIVFFGAVAGAFVGGAWGVTKATDWLEERRVKRDDAKLDQLNNTKK